jgi:hypothetical protein
MLLRRILIAAFCAISFGAAGEASRNLSDGAFVLDGTNKADDGFQINNQNIDQSMLLVGRKPQYAPALQWNFVAAGALPSWVSYSTTSNRMILDATGTLTYAPNNQLLNSATLSTQNVTTKPANYILSFYGTGSITLSGTASATLSGTGATNQVYLAFSPTAGTLTLTVSGSVTSAALAQVTYETAPRPGDQVITGGSIYYGPAFDHDSSGNPLGLRIEESRTNIVAYCNDLTNAAWTAGATMTVAKNQTGVDGVANSASLLTGGLVSSTNTILQSITLSSSARAQSAYVKRITGSGVVNMTMDGGTTWTAITVTSGWTRVSIPTQTIANPNVGFQIVTNGDAIAVQYVDNENGSFITSPIPNLATGTATRAPDIANFVGQANSLLTKNNSGIIIQVSGLQQPNYAFFLGIGSTGLLYNNGLFTALNNSVGGVSAQATTVSSQTIPFRAGTTWSTLLKYTSGNGSPVGVGIGPGTGFTPSSTATLAATGTGTNSIDGYVTSCAIYGIFLPKNVLIGKTTIGAPY